MSEITDTERLEWLIKRGYTPAKWRPLEKGEDPRSASENGLVYVGMGGREEIDQAIKPHLQPSTT